MNPQIVKKSGWSHRMEVRARSSPRNSWERAMEEKQERAMRWRELAQRGEEKRR